MFRHFCKVIASTLTQLSSPSSQRVIPEPTRAVPPLLAKGTQLVSSWNINEGPGVSSSYEWTSALGSSHGPALKLGNSCKRGRVQHTRPYMAGRTTLEADTQQMRTSRADGNPALLILDSSYPEDRLPRNLKASGSFMLNLRRRLAQSTDSDLLLQRIDFPDSYTDDWEHPEDYVLTDKPVWEVIDHYGREQRRRTILRTCFRVAGGMYLPFSAILDTGAPHPLYLSHKLYKLLIEHDRIKVFAKGGDCVVINGEPYLVVATPPVHQPGNVIGLDLLYELGWGLRKTKDKERRVYDTFENPMVF